MILQVFGPELTACGQDKTLGLIDVIATNGSVTPGQKHEETDGTPQASEVGASLLLANRAETQAVDIDQREYKLAIGQAIP